MIRLLRFDTFRGTSFTSYKFVLHMSSLRIPPSRTLVYNPQSNGQCEKLMTLFGQQWNWLWKQTICLDWKSALPEALHFILSLLCAGAINATPHERFDFERCSSLGCNLVAQPQSWPRVFMRHARSKNFEPIVDEAEPIHSTPGYIHVRFQNCRESTASVRENLWSLKEIHHQKSLIYRLCWLQSYWV